MSSSRLGRGTEIKGERRSAESPRSLTPAAAFYEMPLNTMFACKTLWALTAIGRWPRIPAVFAARV
jgi:hypothetical protein